jgi:16S rRNA (guanine527-N7)-methyltransferase
VETSRIADLLEPYLTPVSLEQKQLQHISTYIDILLRWNSRINLTAVREPDEIVRRHFGESLFAARHLFPDPVNHAPIHVIDVGSGAGFPGLPIKLWISQAHVTLIEANHKKVAFLREVIRGLALTDIQVFQGRGEDYRGLLGDVVTLRAVDKFESALLLAIKLAASAGQVALLIGQSQSQTVRDLTPAFEWSEPVILPGSLNRVLMTGVRDQNPKEPNQ